MKYTNSLLRRIWICSIITSESTERLRTIVHGIILHLFSRLAEYTGCQWQKVSVMAYRSVSRPLDDHDRRLYTCIVGEYVTALLQDDGSFVAWLRSSVAVVQWCIIGCGVECKKKKKGSSLHERNIHVLTIIDWSDYYLTTVHN